MENARCILEEAQHGKEFWGQAVLTAAHIHNHLPSRSHTDMAPLEYWTGKPPGVGHLRVFGSTTWVHIPKEKRQKLDPKSVKGILVGYEQSSGSRVYRLYEPKEKRFLTSRDVIIDESTTVIEHHERSDTTIGWGNNTKTHAPEKRRTTRSESDFSPLDTITPALDMPAPAGDIQETITVRPVLPLSSTKDSRAIRGRAREAVRKQNPSLPRRSERRGNPTKEDGSQANYALFAGEEEAEPQTLTEALSGTQKEAWPLAWLSELNSLAKNETWVMEILPEGRTPIGCRWLFRNKDDGRFEAR